MIVRALIFYLAIVVLINACTSNKLDEQPKVDCNNSTLTFSTTIGDAECGQSNGTIEVKATGGEIPYLYEIDDKSAQSTAVFDNLIAGTYSVKVTDNAMCTSVKEVTVGNVGGFQATATITSSGCKTSNGSITAQPSGGVAPYSYQLNGGTSQSSAQFAGLSADTYEVLITDDSGCSFSIMRTISTGISYTSSVAPIIANSCAVSGCHDGSTAQTNFSIFSNVQNSASSIKSRTQSGSMPKNGSLTQAEKDAIACWVDDGALDN